MSKVVRIDGHDIRPEAIDAVTEAEITLGGVSEGTDKMARAKFDILVRGQRITIYRAKRSQHEKAASDAAVADVRKAIIAVRESVVIAMGANA